MLPGDAAISDNSARRDHSGAVIARLALILIRGKSLEEHEEPLRSW
jgi:hypothetical protein